MSTESTGECQDLIVRLRRIEGQVKGIQRMVEEGRPCREVLTQIVAARSGLDQVGVQVFQRDVGQCLNGGASPEQVQELQETIRVWARHT